MNTNWMVFFFYYKLVGDAEYALVSSAAMDIISMKTDQDYYRSAKTFNDAQKNKFGFGFSLLVQSKQSVPTVIEGNPIIEEDHDERDRVFFEDEKTFYETLKSE